MRNFLTLFGKLFHSRAAHRQRYQVNYQKTSLPINVLRLRSFGLEKDQWCCMFKMMGFASAGLIRESCDAVHEVYDASMPRNCGTRGSRSVLKKNAGKALRGYCRKGR